MKKTLSVFLAAIMLLSLFVIPASAASTPKYLFDHVWYADKYSDLKAAYGYDYTKLWNHWNSYGKREGRSPSPCYEPDVYLAANSDLQRAIGKNYVALYNHFSTCGVNEFRRSSSLYDGSVYRDNYADLRNAFGSNSKAYIEHFANYYRTEGRNANTRIGSSTSSAASTSASNTSASSTVAYGKVTTSSANLNVRKSASTSSSIIGSLKKGAQVELLSTSKTNGFYKIKFNSGTGYVSAQYITITSTSGSSSSSGSSGTASSSGSVYATVNTSSANLILRKSASSSSARLASMPKGSRVEVLSTTKTNGFYKVKYNGITGYASASYLKLESSSGSSGSNSGSSTLNPSIIAVTPSINLTPLTTVKYASYNGINYASTLLSAYSFGKISKTEYNNRVAILEEAKRMATVLWTSPVTFHTWKSTAGSYNSNKSMVHSGSASSNYTFTKGVTYKGIPYAANAGSNTYTVESWLNLVSSSSSKSTFEGSVTYLEKTRTQCTSKGIDCSGFVYRAYQKMSGYKLGYLTTSGLLDSSSWKKTSSPMPGDILLKSGHVMIYVGKTSSGKIAVFESVADGTNGTSGCRYYEFNSVSGYSYYRYTGIAG